MFTVIFCSFGTASLFSQPKRFISAGTVSLLYRSCNRVFMSLFFLVPGLSSLTYRVSRRSVGRRALSSHREEYCDRFARACRSRGKQPLHSTHSPGLPFRRSRL